MCYGELQWVAVSCNELQWVAVSCSELRWVAVGCSEVQCVIWILRWDYTKAHHSQCYGGVLFDYNTSAMCEQLLCVIQCVAVCSPVPCVSKLQFMLQCVVLQCVAVCCNVLQCNAVYLLNIRVRSNQSPIPPTNCNPLQTTAHFATHCNTLQHTATHCNYLMIGTHASFRSSNPHIMNVLLIRLIRIRHLFVAVYCSVLQCVAVCCSVLQCVAVCCSVLQGVAVCCGVLQSVAMHVWSD